MREEGKYFHPQTLTDCPREDRLDHRSSWDGQVNLREVIEVTRIVKRLDIDTDCCRPFSGKIIEKFLMISFYLQTHRI